MDIKELRQKSVDELKKELLDLLQHQFTLRMQKGSNQLTKTHHLKEARKDIARIKTLIAQANHATATQTVGE